MFDENHKVDAWKALVRNAVAAEEGPRRVSPLAAPRLRLVRAELPDIPDDVRAEYQYAFDERIGMYIDSGMDEKCASRSIMPDCCAYHETLLELGALEVWDWIEERRRNVPPLRPLVIEVPAAEKVYCSRCESVGHVVVNCPFPVGDADVARIAAYRRERRGRIAA